MKLIRHPFFLGVFLGFFPALVGCAQAEPQLVEAAILVEITPGKPDAPTEIVEVIRAPSAVHLRVRRQAANGAVLSQAETTLDLRDFSALWAVVDKHRLKEFVPQERAQAQVADFGVRRCRISWRTEAEETPRIHEVEWSRPLTNRQNFRPLIAELKSLLSRQAPEFTLYYFN